MGAGERRATGPLVPQQPFCTPYHLEPLQLAAGNKAVGGSSLRLQKDPGSLASRQAGGDGEDLRRLGRVDMSKGMARERLDAKFQMATGARQQRTLLAQECRVFPFDVKRQHRNALNEDVVGQVARGFPGPVGRGFRVCPGAR